MYPRNAASPERIAVGAVVQISDGAVQTTGVSISVRGQGGASGAGSGTTAYDNGIVEYTPTQGETDFTSFVVVAYKTGCIPVAQTIVTTATAVPGTVDVGAISGDSTAADNAESFFDGTGYAGTGNTIPTVTTLTGHTAQSGDSYARLGAPAGASVSADIATIDTNVDTLVSRITSTLFSGITSLAEWLGAMAGKQASDATAQTEMRATGAGLGAYDATTDSQEALRDHVGDGTNLTEAGGNGDHLTAINLPDQTMNITGNITGNLSGSVGSVTGNVGGNVTGSVGSLATQAKADVNTEVLDVLNTDTFAEPGQGAPAATASIVAKIGYLYKAWRNKSEQTATEYKLYADDATTVDQKATVSDDTTTATKGEVATGP